MPREARVDDRDDADLGLLYRDRPERWHQIRRQLRRAGLNAYTLLRHTRDSDELHLRRYDAAGRVLTIRELRARRGLIYQGRGTGR
jgi:hypothetical protein